MALSAPQNFLAYIAGKYQGVVAAVIGGVNSAFQIAALDATGRFDITMMPAGIGPEVVVAVASEPIADGRYVNLWSNAGVLSARNADGSTTGKEASGFVLAAVAQGANATVYRVGQNGHVTAQTVGEVWLSTMTPGATQSAPPSGAGCTAQSLGIALSAINIDTKIGQAVALAS